MTRLIACIICVSSISAGSAYTQTIANWNFDSGKAGEKFSALPVTDESGHNYRIRGEAKFGPSYSTVTESGKGLSSRHENQDCYVADPALNRWSPERWTIEVSVRLDAITGRSIIMGRDGSSEPEGTLSDFCFEITEDRCFALSFYTTGGKRYSIKSSFAPAPNRWYHVALVSNGATASIYVNDSLEDSYKLIGAVSMSGPSMAHNALAPTGKLWTFGRGWENKKFVYPIRGYLDDIRFTGRALDETEFLHSALIASPAK